MAQTFSEAYRLVRLHASAAPVFLCREWVQEAWKSLCRRRGWSFLRAETVLRVAAARSVPVTVIQDSATVTSAAAFIAADAGRQFRIPLGPTYTIQTVVDPSTITLDRVYSEPNAVAASATILDAYATMPADFGTFRVIPDRYTRRAIAHWVTEDFLTQLDPDRSMSDSQPRALVAATPSTYTPTLGQIRYEWWPRPTAERSYPAYYTKQAQNLSETASYSGVLADGVDVIIAGALSMAAEWPGTADMKNPYFNPDLARAKKAEFEMGVQRLALADDAQYPDDLFQGNFATWTVNDLFALAGGDNALRSSDATVAAFY